MQEWAEALVNDKNGEKKIKKKIKSRCHIFTAPGKSVLI